jgi:hypothetical protein
LGAHFKTITRKILNFEPFERSAEKGEASASVSGEHGPDKEGKRLDSPVIDGALVSGGGTSNMGSDPTAGKERG